MRSRYNPCRGIVLPINRWRDKRAKVWRALLLNWVRIIKAELEDAKARKAQADYKELLDYMTEHDISADTVLDAIKN